MRSAPWRDARFAVLAAVLAAPLPAGAQTVSVEGAVDMARVLDAQALRALPAETARVSDSGVAGPVTANVVGARLWDVLAVAGLTPVPKSKHALRDLVVATGSDGYAVVYSGGELNPDFGGARPDLVAAADDDARLGGAFRTVIPGDANGARSISRLATLRVMVAAPGPATPGAEAGAALGLDGAVDRPGALTVAALQAMPATTQTVTYGTGTHAQTATFTGVPLWALLEAAGLRGDPAAKNATLRNYVVATARDGYAVALSLGEIDPRVGGGRAPVMVAYARDGVPLKDGTLRLVVPGDAAAGRYVSGLVRLSVRAATQPAETLTQPAPDRPAQ